MGALEENEFCVPQLNSSCRRPARRETAVSSNSVITVALNLLVIVSIAPFRQLHTPTNLLLLSLAVSDLLVGLLLMPVEIVYIEICWFLGDWVCTLYYTLDYVITSASVVNMVLISLDRYVAVCDPLRYPSRVTTGTARLGVCLCWFSSMVFRLLLLQDHIAEPGRSSSCLGECVVVINPNAGCGSHLTNGYYTGVVDTVFTFILPIAVILVLYGRVFSAVLAQARTLRSRVAAIGPRHPGAAAAVRRSELKAAHTLGIVMVVFLICFCPYYFPALEGEHTSVDASSAAFEIWLAHFNQLLPLNRNQQQGLYGERGARSACAGRSLSHGSALPGKLLRAGPHLCPAVLHSPDEHSPPSEPVIARTSEGAHIRRRAATHSPVKLCFIPAVPGPGAKPEHFRLMLEIA
ncbi:trace amine-associated receptor 13c-like [Menidia menidia]